MLANNFSTIKQSQRIVAEGRKQNWDQYQESVTQRDEVLSGDFLHLFKAYVLSISTEESWDLFSRKWVWDTIHRLSSDILESTTKVYKRPAQRLFRSPVETATSANGSEGVPSSNTGAPTFEPDETWERVLESGLAFDYDLEFHRALKMSLAGIGTIVRPFFDPDSLDDNGVPFDDARLMIQVLTADQFVAVVDEFKPEIFRALDYTLSQPDGVNRPVIRRFIWDTTGEYAADALSMKEALPGFYELSEEGDVISTMVDTEYPYIDDNGTFVIPFTAFRPFAPPDRLFERSLGTDLTEATLKANLYEQRKEWTLRNAAHKMLVLSGAGAGKMNDRLVTPGVPVILEGADKGETELTVVDPTSDVKQFTEAIRELYEEASARRGRGISTFVRSAQKQSADAIREERLGEYEYNDTLQTYQRPVETQFADHIRLVWNAGMSEQISDSAGFFVDFGNPFETDPYTNMELRLINVDRNIESVVDIVQDLNPDLSTRDEALEKVRLNRQENRASLQTTEQEATVAEATPPPNAGTETAPTLAETAADQGEITIETETEDLP